MQRLVWAARVAALGFALGWLAMGATPARAQQSWEESDELSTAEPPPLDPDAYDPPRPPGPFDRGRIRVGLGVGWASGVANDWLILGVGGGYYVVDGLELGLDTGFWFVGDPFIATLSPQLRYVLHFVPFVKPYVGTFYKHYFIAEGREDSDSIGARAGLYFMVSSRSYFGGGVVYEHFLDQDLYVDQDQFYPELTFAFAF